MYLAINYFSLEQLRFRKALFLKKILQILWEQFLFFLQIIHHFCNVFQLKGITNGLHKSKGTLDFLINVLYQINVSSVNKVSYFEQGQLQLPAPRQSAGGGNGGGGQFCTTCHKGCVSFLLLLFLLLENKRFFFPFIS